MKVSVIYEDIYMRDKGVYFPISYVVGVSLFFVLNKINNMHLSRLLSFLLIVYRKLCIFSFMNDLSL